MSYILKRLNVVKVVGSLPEKESLISKGFRPINDNSSNNDTGIEPATVSDTHNNERASSKKAEAGSNATKTQKADAGLTGGGNANDSI